MNSSVDPTEIAQEPNIKAEPLGPPSYSTSEVAAILQKPKDLPMAPQINLARSDDVFAIADTIVSPPPPPVTATPLVAPPPNSIPKPVSKPSPTSYHRQLWPAITAAIVVIILTGVGAYVLAIRRPPAKSIAVVRPVPKPKSEPATPVVAPPPVAPIVPAPVVAPQTVTAPTVTPTTDRPQLVTVTSKNGLWLRSSPDSSNRDNIISWIPNGGQVNVDKTGDFWWHGKYNGLAGYFASSYTQ